METLEHWLIFNSAESGGDKIVEVLLEDICVGQGIVELFNLFEGDFCCKEDEYFLVEEEGVINDEVFLLILLLFDSPCFDNDCLFVCGGIISEFSFLIISPCCCCCISCVDFN